LTIGAWQSGTPFDSGLSGTSGVSTSRDGEHHYSVFWRQGTHLAAMTVFGPDAARAASDATVLARLESDALQNAIGGGRTVLDLPEGTSSKLGPARDLTRWVVGGGAAMILAAFAMIVIFSTVLRRGKPQRLALPAAPPRAAPES
jgi:hypothetical protein